MPPLAVQSAASLVSAKPLPLHALAPPYRTPAALAVLAMKVVAAKSEAAAGVCDYFRAAL